MIAYAAHHLFMLAREVSSDVDYVFALAKLYPHLHYIYGGLLSLRAPSVSFSPLDSLCSHPLKLITEVSQRNLPNHKTNRL